MIIKKMNADYGMLNGQQMELQPGLNIITAPNESGKSTWCSFIKNMLYGLDTSAREKQGEKPDKTKYAPWSGTAMSGSMELEHEGKDITLRRWTEKANAPMQVFSATYSGTEDKVPGLEAATAGETLTGVSRDVFERSAFVRQSGMTVSNSAALEKRINAIISTGEEKLGYSEMDKRLHQWQRHRKSGSHGAIPELEQSIAEADGKLRQLRQNAVRAAALDEETEQLKQQKAEAVKLMEQARAKQRKQALDELFKSRQEMRQLEQEQTEAEQACREKQEALEGTVFAGAEPDKAKDQAADIKRRASGLEKLSQKTPPLWISYIFLTLFVIAIGASFILPWQKELLISGALALILFAMFFLRLNDMKKNALGMLEDRLKLLEPYGGTDEQAVDDALAEYMQLWEEKQSAEAELSALQQKTGQARLLQKEADDVMLEGLDFSKGDSEAAQAGRLVDELNSRLEDINRRRAMLEGESRSVGDLSVLESDRLEQQRQLDAVNEDYDALTLAIETLAEADSELKNRFSPLLSRKAAEYFAFLTDKRYDEITLARDMSAKARLSGDAVGHETSYLSAGTTDQLYLALRLAVCELALPGDEPCPIVLDDALVNFDEQRMGRALELIRSMAEKRQIILFSCHEREENYFKKHPAAAAVTVS